MQSWFVTTVSSNSGKPPETEEKRVDDYRETPARCTAGEDSKEENARSAE
jgi:hypothetical protein